jgi:hypothetical protein
MEEHIGSSLFACGIVCKHPIQPRPGVRGSQEMEQVMPKLTWIIPVAFLFASNLALAGQDRVKTSGSWSGVIINSGCTVDEAFAEAAKCTDNVQGTRLVFYDDTTRQIYDLDPQGQAVGHLGEAVTVHGALEANTIHVASLELLTSTALREQLGLKLEPHKFRSRSWL